jgi:hypothetical protein
VPCKDLKTSFATVKHALSHQLPHGAATLRVPLSYALHNYSNIFLSFLSGTMVMIPILFLSTMGFGLSSLVNAEPSSVMQLQQKSLATLSSNASDSSLRPVVDLRRRQITSYQSTCGFETGDPNQPRTAQSGFDCRTDTINGLWGFCPTAVISATDCGLAGNCVDSFACTSGCGIFGNTKITTFTWYVIAPITS